MTDYRAVGVTLFTACACGPLEPLGDLKLDLIALISVSHSLTLLEVILKLVDN